MALVAELLDEVEGGAGFGFAEVEEEDFCAGVDVGGEEFGFLHDVVDAIDAKGDADAGDTGDAEGAGEVVVAAAAADAAHFDAAGL